MKVPQRQWLHYTLHLVASYHAIIIKSIFERLLPEAVCNRVLAILSCISMAGLGNLSGAVGSLKEL